MLLRRHICERLAAYYAQPSHKVVGSIDSRFASRVPSEIKSADAAPVAAKEPSRHPPSHSSDKAASAASRSQFIRRRRVGEIDFASLWGEWHWKRTYRRVYEEQQGRWLTPCELFRPHYSNVFANFVAKTVKSSLESSSGSEIDGEEFEIVELGGGRGTNAEILLDHLQQHNSNLYSKLRRYTIFDTSKTLHELQREALVGSTNKKLRSNDYFDCQHADKIELVNVDMMDVAEGNAPFLSPSNIPTVVIALELLDNLPHDKIGRCTATRSLLQAEVVPIALGEYDCGEDEEGQISSLANDPGKCIRKTSADRGYMETFVPLDDPLLSRIMSMAPALYSPATAHGPMWIPTVALGVLMRLFESRPNSNVVFADFDWLPPPEVHSFASAAANYQERGDNQSLSAAEPATGDPLVTDMDGNDHLSYLTPPPDALCDILFPSDFSKLAAFVQKVRMLDKSETKDKRNARKKSSRAMKQSDFLMKYGKTEVEQTKSFLTGYSPLIHDFGNCSVLVVT